MPTINWNEASPADTDSAGLGDDEIRSLKTSIRVGLDGEHNWPSGGGADTGYHRLGSARPYYGAQSLVSSSGSDARLMQTSDTSRLFHVGSAGTSFIGGPTVLSVATYPGTVPQRHYWAMEMGEARIITSGGTTVSFPNSGFSGKPFTQVTLSRKTAGSGEIGYAVLENLTATSLGLVAFDEFGAGLSNTSVFWQSIGTRVL